MGSATSANISYSSSIIMRIPDGKFPEISTGHHTAPEYLKIFAMQILFVIYKLTPIAFTIFIYIYPEFRNGYQQHLCSLEAHGLSETVLKLPKALICSSWYYVKTDKAKNDTRTAKSIGNILTDKTEDVIEINRQFADIPDLTGLSKNSYHLETLANKVEYFSSFTETSQISSSLERLSEGVSTIVSNFIELRVQSKYAIRNTLELFETVSVVLKDYQNGKRSLLDLQEAYENSLEEITENHLGSLEKITIAAEYAVLDAREETTNIRRRLSKQRRIIQDTKTELESIWPWEGLDRHQKKQLKLDLQVYGECVEIVDNIAESTHGWRVMVQELRISLKHAKSNILKISDTGISLPEQITILEEKMNVLREEVHLNSYRYRVKGD